MGSFVHTFCIRVFTGCLAAVFAAGRAGAQCLSIGRTASVAVAQEVFGDETPAPLR